MKATTELRHEHDAVLVALRILDKVAAAVAQNDARAPGDLERLLDFFRVFVDKCHHGKEEDVLFPELERRGVRREGGPVGVMLAEHEVGRGHVRAMAENLQKVRAGDSAAAAAITEHAAAYRAMLQMHIQKENNVLFPMAERVVPAEVAERIAGQFAAIEQGRVGEGKHEAYHAMLRETKDRYGVE